MKDRLISGLVRSFFAHGLLFVLLFSPSMVRAQTINWTKYDNTTPVNADSGVASTNGKVPLGSGAGRGDLIGVYGPTVIKEGSTYKMWYAGYSVGTTYRIYHATSSNGLAWTKYDNTIPAISDTTSTNGKIPLGNSGRGDSSYVSYPTVIKEGSTYKMWYAGYNGANTRIYYATSTNGLEWAKYDNGVPTNTDSGVASTNGKVPLGSDGRGDDNIAFSPFVIKDDSTYKMWYTGYDATNYRIYYATSSNGLEWTKYDNTVPATSDGTSTNGKIPLGSNGSGDDVGVISPFVLKDGSTYKMWYTGLDGTSWRIYHATSSNGLEWTKYNNTTPPVSDTTNSNSRIGLGTGTKGDDTHVGNPSVIKDDSSSTYKMWHGGHDGASWRIYYSTAPIPPPAGTIFTLK